MSVVRERCSGETKVSGSPPGGDRRPGGWLLGRPVADAMGPHCWSWFISFSRAEERRGRTPPPSVTTAVARCMVSHTDHVARVTSLDVCHVFGTLTDWGGYSDASVRIVAGHGLDAQGSVPYGGVGSSSCYRVHAGKLVRGDSADVKDLPILCLSSFWLASRLLCIFRFKHSGRNTTL